MIRHTGRTPMFIPPMLCDVLRDPARLDDSRYAAEPKCDGQRAQALGMLPSSRLRHPVFVGEEARRRAPPGVPLTMTYRMPAEVWFGRW